MTNHILTLEKIYAGNPERLRLQEHQNGNNVELLWGSQQKKVGSPHISLVCKIKLRNNHCEQAEKKKRHEGSL